MIHPTVSLTLKTKIRSGSSIKRSSERLPGSKPVVQFGRQQIPTTCFAAPVSVPIGASTQSSDKTDALTLKPLPKDVEGLVDDPSLHNPLLRLQRLGTDWMGVILELEGVCVELEYGDVSTKAWIQVAQDEGRIPPPQWALRRAEGMKNEQIIQEVFCWTRNPVEVRRFATKKEEILGSLLSDRKPLVPPGVVQLIANLRRNNVPIALVSSAPEARVLSTLEQVGLASVFDAVLTADDVHRGKPDPEPYLYAAQAIGRPPLRCVVIGNSNLSIEASHEVGMQCIALAGAGGHPVYELSAADLVVRDLGDVSFLNMKKLFAQEQSRMASSGEPMLETEQEEEEDYDYDHDDSYSNLSSR